MTDLFNALYVCYQGSDLKDTLTELYNTFASENAVFPYAVYSIINITPSWTFGENFEECLIQFNLFSKTTDATQVSTLFDLLIANFDFAELSIANYDMVSMTRESAILTKVEDVWQYNITYIVLLGQN